VVIAVAVALVHTVLELSARKYAQIPLLSPEVATVTVLPVTPVLLLVKHISTIIFEVPFQ